MTENERLRRRIAEVLEGRGPFNKRLTRRETLEHQLAQVPPDDDELAGLVDSQDWETLARLAYQYTWLGKPLPPPFFLWFDQIERHATGQAPWRRPRGRRKNPPEHDARIRKAVALCVGEGMSRRQAWDMVGGCANLSPKSVESICRKGA